MPVAIVYDASTHAVLMATPTALEDLAVGFSLTEGIVENAGAIRAVEVIEQDAGIEVRIWLQAGASLAHLDRRRAIIGVTGCGLCGIESLAEATRPVRRVEATASFTAHDVGAAVAALRDHQPLGNETRAVHAAGLWYRGAYLAVREDVGRHNALDKLAGALAHERRRRDGIVVLSSRVSIEMVQKTAWMGVGCIVAISAPTSLATRAAEEAGITLVAVARDDGFEVFTHRDRIAGAVPT